MVVEIVEARPAAVGLHDDRAATGDVELAGVLVHVPSTYSAAHPAGVLVMLHGAGGTASQALRLVKRFAEAENLLVIAPKSAASTWDRLHDGFGPDVRRIDQVLAAVFARYAVDPDRVAIGGFSDGASYALTLGLANGDLFRSILAFSPGLEAAPERRGRPRIFIAHGTDDRVLPIHLSHRIVRDLRHGRYDLTFLEFAGGHDVPEEALVHALALVATLAS